MRNAERIPVIAGVGQVNDHTASLDSLGLMEAAARAAELDADAPLLAQTDWFGITSQLSFPQYYGHLADALQPALGFAARHIRETILPTGDSPILLMNEAANAIGSGEARIALIVGGEALRTASRRAAEQAEAAGTAARNTGPLPPRALRTDLVCNRYGLITPTEIYPLYENATRAAYRQTFAEAQAESARIWALFSEVAAQNPHAWLHEARTPGDIMTPGPDNRPIAFPYLKLMVANAAVNQGAAVIVTSLAAARGAGVPEDRLIYIGRGAAAHENDDPLLRARFEDSPSMTVSLRKTLELNDLTAGDLDLVELYSCFPCVPKMARRIIDWPVDRPASVFGGLTFGGGPIGNYMAHAAASMVDALRRRGGTGMLYANGGYATHNHAIVLTRAPQPAGLFPQAFDFNAEADRLRGPIPPVDETYRGAALLETYTVLYDRAGAPRFGVAIGRAPDGRRVIGRVAGDDAAGIAFLTSAQHDPVGTPGEVTSAGELNRWVPAT